MFTIQFVNLPIQGILTTTKFWLNRNIDDNELIKHTLYILEIIMKQNYFQYNGQFLQPDKGIAMGSPISRTMAEVYLQYTGCIIMIGAVLKLIIFTSMVYRIINTSRNERVILQVLTHTYICSMYAPFVTRHTSRR